MAKKIKNLFKNKFGYSMGFSWIFALTSLFAIGLLFIVFDQVFMGYLAPTIVNQVNSSTSGIDSGTQLQIIANIDKWLVYWHALPFILYGCIILYLIIAAIRREGEQEQF